MVVVVIISILAAIAYPSYTDQVRKARRVDGKSAILEVAMAEERYYTEHKTYTSNLNNLSIHAALKSGTSIEGHYTLSLSAPDATSFTVTAKAIGAQADDKACAEMSINQRGEKRSSNGTATTSGCW